MEKAATILEFWFGTDPNDAAVAEQRAPLWWSKSPETDGKIRNRFETLVLAAGSGDLEDWQASTEGRLALILLTDQFPRNIHRDTPAAFRFDPMARKLCLEGLSSGADKNLGPVQRVFFYLPLEHSEDLGHQNRCVELFQDLTSNVSADLKLLFEGYVDFALRHHAIIERFGRFPHRNAILGRSSTPEEINFLAQPNSSF